MTKDFKETEIGLIPEDWEIKTVKQLIDADVLEKPIDGNHGSIHPKGSDFVPSGIPFIMASDLKNGKVDIHNCSFIRKSQADNLKKGFSKEGDVLLSHKATIGRTAIVSGLNTDYIILTPQVTYYRVKNLNKLNNLFLKYYFDFKNFKQLFVTWAESGGSTRAYLGIVAQQKLPIIIPPITEQRKICGIVSSIDEKIQLNQEMNRTLEAIGQAIFRHWFVHYEFPDENGQPYKSGGGEMLDSELGEIPMGWEIATISDLCSSITNGGTPKRKEPSYWENGSIPWFKTGELFDSPLIDSEEHITEEGLNNSSCKLWCPNTILIALYASPTVGRLGILKNYATSNQACSGLVAKKDVGYQYLFYTLLFKRGELNSIAVGSAQQNISQDIVKNTKTIIPSPNITIKFQELIEPLFEQRTLFIEESKSLSKIRDSLLPMLMSGKIRVVE